MGLSVHDTQKQYVLPSQFLVSESARTYSLTYGDSLSTARLLKTDAYQYQDVTTARTYNFIAIPTGQRGPL